MLLLPPYSSPLYFRDVMCLVSVSQVLLDMYLYGYACCFLVDIHLVFFISAG